MPVRSPFSADIPYTAATSRTKIELRGGSGIIHQYMPLTERRRPTELGDDMLEVFLPVRIL
jgi:hypothetical protein